MPIQFPLDLAQRFAGVGQALTQPFGLQALDVLLVADGELHPDPVAVGETVRLAKRFRHDENVAKKNRGIEGEPAEGLKRHFGGQVG